MPLTVDAQIPYAESVDIKVDGVRDEPAWADAMAVPEALVTFQPSQGALGTGGTSVWLTADAHALYIAAELTDDPSKLRHSIGRRDTRFADDFFAVYLDPTGDAQRAYLFLVSAGGILHDGTATAANGEDIAWDAAWSGAAKITATGYTVEMAIPWHAVRHPRTLDDLGLFVFRHVARLGEKASWPRLDPAVQGLLVQEAVVRGPGELPRDPGLDLLPELTFGWSDQGPVEGPFTVGGVSAGLTTRYVPVPSVSLLGTFNPDFSQVESDAAQISVNRRNALYYQEKRPFFLDGQEWFSHPLGELVYTRTVVAPYGGMRATLEPPGATVAALWAMDAAPGPTVSEGGGWTEQDLDGHAASVGVVRLRKNLGADGQVGVLLSDRTILGTPLANRVGGVDARVRLSDVTTVVGSAMASTTSFADGPTALAPAGNLEISASQQYGFAGAWASLIAPSFRAENGYVTLADRIGGGAYLGTSATPDSKLVPRFSITPVSAWYATTFAGELRDLGVQCEGNGMFGNGVQFGGGASANGERFAGAWLPSRVGWGWLNGAPAEWLELDLSVTSGLAPYYDPDAPRSGFSVSAGGGATVHPSPRLAFGVRGSYERFDDDGLVLYAGWVGRARADVFLSRTLSGRAILDVDTFTGGRAGEALLAWERSPGTGLYLGGSGGLPTADLPGAWTVFAKASTVLSPRGRRG